MNNGSLTFGTSSLDLAIMEAETSGKRFSDFVFEGLQRGIPAEILTRLKAAWDTTCVIAGEVVAIGRIVVSKMMEFLGANPQIPALTALGAAAGALMGTVPFLGPILAPFTITGGALLGAAMGAHLASGGVPRNSLESLASDALAYATALARKFFELLISTLRAVDEYLEGKRDAR